MGWKNVLIVVLGQEKEQTDRQMDAPTLRTHLIIIFIIINLSWHLPAYSHILKSCMPATKFFPETFLNLSPKHVNGLILFGLSSKIFCSFWDIHSRLRTSIKFSQALYNLLYTGERHELDPTKSKATTLFLAWFCENQSLCQTHSPNEKERYSTTNYDLQLTKWLWVFVVVAFSPY